MVWEDVMGCGWFRKENLDCEGGLGRRNWSQGWFWENKWGDVGRRSSVARVVSEDRMRGLGLFEEKEVSE